MTLEIQNNNLITRAISKPAEQNKQTAPVQESKPDTFEKNTAVKKTVPPKEPSKKMKILNGILSTAFFIGIFFLPDLIFARRNKTHLNLLDKYRNFKPVIGEVITGQKQEVLKNGRVKLTLENIKGKFKYNEILIMDKAKIKQRIIIKKEQMPNGKYVVRGVKSYKGNNLIDNAEINKNEAKYLFKEFKRSKIENKQYTTTVTRKGKNPETAFYHSTSNGEPVLRIKENNKQKENMTFLYANDHCVGTDNQIIPKNATEKQYNILNIPKEGIKNYKYDLQTDGHQYDERLTEKLRENF